ncbi:hypothetical protein HU200_022788 [Digitaria exilis]|uniref:Acidic protein n=1 Tax=Digitaria exilis TaxID=1010633 RepID=A0A835CCT0_9POAL|nr:hypothetical protein HU200_022788 [Digitaria exilis]
MEAAGKGLKSFVAVVLVLGLLLGQQQIQVEAKIRCPSSQARDLYFMCIYLGKPRPLCETISGCKVVHRKCNDGEEHAGFACAEDDAMALEFCKLGCAASSLCDNNIKQAVGNEETSDAVNSCDEACYRFCTKHDHTAALLLKQVHPRNAREFHVTAS